MTHREVGYMQAFLTIIFVVGYFWTLRDFIHGRISVPTEWRETLQGLMNLLTGGLLTMIAFWFARQRQSTDPPDKAL